MARDRKRAVHKVTKKGFTLLELLVAVGVLSVLLGVTLIAINPFEQTNKAADLAVKATAQDFIVANIDYFVTEKMLPWDKETDCLAELEAGGSLAAMPTCIRELTKAGAMEEKFMQNSDLQNIHVTKCGDSAVICYSPRSKIEYEDAGTKYDKFGVNQPGCPGSKGSGVACYWCKPVMKAGMCTPVTPSPTVVPTNAPTATIAVAATPTIIPIPQLVLGYANDETKLLKTYAVFFFDYPGFPPPPGAWSIHFSLRSDFGGDYTQTHTSFATGTDYTHTGPANASYTAYRKLTTKYVAFQSLAGLYDIYRNNCGKTVYWRVANYYNPSAADKKTGPTYTGVIDCTTKVGVVDPPLSWYTVYDQLQGRQKQYDVSWDFDASGAIDWTDYWLGAFSTKTRYGGWQPPE